MSQDQHGQDCWVGRGMRPPKTLSMVLNQAGYFAGEGGADGTCTLVPRPVISIMRKEMSFCWSEHKNIGEKKPWDLTVVPKIFLRIQL